MHYLVIFSLLLAASVYGADVEPAAANTAASATRIWTSASGKQIEAEYVETKYGKVVLRQESGELIRIAMSGLSPVDQEWIRAADAPPAEGALEIAPAKSGRLPTILKGEWKGNYAVYRHDHFDALVHPTGYVAIHVKDDGEPVGKPLRITPIASYTEIKNGKNVYRRRRIAEFTTYPDPTLDPTRIELTGTLKDNVSFWLSYEFKDNEVHAWGCVEDPDDIEWETRYSVNCRFTASHKFEHGTPGAEQERILGPYSVVIKPTKGKQVAFPYVKSTKSFGGGGAQDVWVDGPLFGKRQVNVTASSYKAGGLNPYIYPGNAPFQGYNVGFSMTMVKPGFDNRRMILRVE